MSAALREELRDFVYREARLLDEGHFDEWLQLFAKDGVYWMPLEPGQTDPKHVTSLLYEDLFMLTLRVRRLEGARTFSQYPPSRGHHLLAWPAVDEADEDANVFVVTTAFHYVETRLDDQELYAGWARHELIREDGAFKIALKRVDLVNCDAAFGNIQLMM
ncbi:MAG: aromatic-ring-hydroxylating dioxygenase subunit beta [Pseudomonadota bacterium]